MPVSGEELSVRENSKCKGPEKGRVCLACSGPNKKVSVAGTKRARRG